MAAARALRAAAMIWGISFLVNEFAPCHFLGTGITVAEVVESSFLFPLKTW